MRSADRAVIGVVLTPSCDCPRAGRQATRVPWRHVGPWTSSTQSRGWASTAPGPARASWQACACSARAPTREAAQPAPVAAGTAASSAPAATQAGHSGQAGAPATRPWLVACQASTAACAAWRAAATWATTCKCAQAHARCTAQGTARAGPGVGGYPWHGRRWRTPRRRSAVARSCAAGDQARSTKQPRACAPAKSATAARPSTRQPNAAASAACQARAASSQACASASAACSQACAQARPSRAAASPCGFEAGVSTGRQRRGR